MESTHNTLIQRTMPRFDGWFWLSIAWVAAIALLTTFADVLPFADPLEMTTDRRLERSSADYLLGTDALGRDLFSRAVFGARISLALAFIVPPIGLAIGLIIGTTAAFYGGTVDRIIVMLIDSYLAFPVLVLYLGVVAFWGVSLAALFVLFTIGVGVFMTRLARANALSIMERDYVRAARGLGASDFWIICRVVAPNVALPLIAWSPLLASGVIAAEGSLSFLGLSVAPPTPTWGNMIEGGRSDLVDSPHVALVPIGMLFLTVLSFNLIGDGLRRRFDVRGGVL